MEFLCRSNGGDGPLVAFGSSDGAIRVLSMITWKLARRYTGGHKGAISCLMTFLSASGEVLEGVSSFGMNHKSSIVILIKGFN
nr:transducin/WD40 repeat-like superfamily protein [Ipomoea batatas]